MTGMSLQDRTLFFWDTFLQLRRHEEKMREIVPSSPSSDMVNGVVEGSRMWKKPSYVPSYYQVTDKTRYESTDTSMFQSSKQSYMHTEQSMFQSPNQSYKSTEHIMRSYMHTEQSRFHSPSQSCKNTEQSRFYLPNQSYKTTEDIMFQSPNLYPQVPNLTYKSTEQRMANLRNLSFKNTNQFMFQQPNIPNLTYKSTDHRIYQSPCMSYENTDKSLIQTPSTSYRSTYHRKVPNIIYHKSTKQHLPYKSTKKRPSHKTEEHKTFQTTNLPLPLHPNHQQTCAPPLAAPVPPLLLSNPILMLHTINAQKISKSDCDKENIKNDDNFVELREDEQTEPLDLSIQNYDITIDLPNTSNQLSLSFEEESKLSNVEVEIIPPENVSPISTETVSVLKEDRNRKRDTAPSLKQSMLCRNTERDCIATDQTEENNSVDININIKTSKQLQKVVISKAKEKDLKYSKDIDEEAMENGDFNAIIETTKDTPDEKTINNNNLTSNVYSNDNKKSKKRIADEVNVNRKMRKYLKMKKDETEAPHIMPGKQTDINGQHDMLNDLQMDKNVPQSLCSLSDDCLTDGLRVLLRQDGLFYPGRLTCILPPDIYGVLVDKERGNKPHIFSREEVINEAIHDQQPATVSELSLGARVCAYWSSKMNYLHPGTVAGPDVEEDYVIIQHDDGDSRGIHIDRVRYLPENYPLYDTTISLGRPHPTLAMLRMMNMSSIVRQTIVKKKSEADIEESKEKLKSEVDPRKLSEEPKDTSNKYKSEKKTFTEISPFLPNQHLLWSWSDEGRKLSTKARKVHHDSIKKGDETIHVGDCAVFLSTGRPDRPYIGRIHSMWQTSAWNMKVQVNWFYHPAEVEGTAVGGGRVEDIKTKGALFESCHFDENDIHTISHKCHILEVDQFKQRLQIGGDQTTTELYYLAGEYDPVEGVIVFRQGVFM